jgi:hypothetical protein
MRSLTWAYFLLGTLVTGCPASEDIYQYADAGLSRQDILLPGGDSSSTDLGSNIEQDNGVITTGDTGTVECTTPGDCDLVASACEIVRCTQGQCVLGQLDDGGACDDSNPCTVTACVKGACVKTDDTTCPDDGNPCTAEICNPDTGCATLATQGTPCNDDDPCTDGDKCANGACQPGTKVCDVGTADNPADSCAALKKTEPTKPSAVYYVKDKAGVATAIYCDMTTQGGGWMRIASIDGTVPLCNLSGAIGTAQGVQAGTGTSVLPSAYVASLPTTSSDLLVVVSKGAMIFRSTHAEWGWDSVATGKINAANSGTYTLQVSVDGGAFELLKSNPTSAIAKGGTLLGGLRNDGKYTPSIGIGAYSTGTFTQDVKCAALTGNGGVWGGTIYPGIAVWKQPAAIYVR